MDMEYWWNDTDKEKPKHSEKNLSHCHFLSPTNMTCPGLGLAPSSAVTGQQLTA